MSKLIRINEDLSLPLDIVTMRTAEYGDSGSGKTAFARLIAEKVHEAHHRFCAIDLKNDWWGLKSSADGSAAGIPVVIFGGPRADVKLIDDTAAAKALADTVASIEQSVVLDLDALSRRKQEKFLTAFLEQLYEVNRRPLLLMCDEADRYAPQKPMTQEAVMSLSASEDICRRGRKRGIGQFWLTQRTAVLNKNVSDLCNLTVVFRTPGARDLDELEDRVGRIASRDVVKEVMKEAPGLADGQAFFLSSHPKLRRYLPDPVRPIQLPMPSTFDSSATPGVGSRRREPKVLAKTDLVAIESRMAEQVQRAKDEDPKELQKKLADANRELEQLRRAAATPAPGKVELKTREVPILKDSQLKRLEQLVTRFATLTEKYAAQATAAYGHHASLVEIRDQVGAQLTSLTGSISLARSTPPTPPAIVPAPAVCPPMTAAIPPAHRPVPAAPRRPDDHAADGQQGSGPRPLKKGARKIAAVLCQWHPQRLDRQVLQFRAGFARDSGTFTDYLSMLRSHGMLDEQGDGIGATQAAFDWVGDDVESRPSTPKDYLDNAMKMKFVKGGAKPIGEFLIGQYPRIVARDELRSAAGFAEGSGTFTDYLSQMRRAGIVVDHRQGLQANPAMFETHQ